MSDNKSTGHDHEKVDQYDSCPKCGENRVDLLHIMEQRDDNGFNVECQSCGKKYGTRNWSF